MAANSSITAEMKYRNARTSRIQVLSDGSQLFPDGIKQRWGSDGDAYMQYVAARNAIELNRRAVLLDLDGADCSDRLTLIERFARAPLLNASVGVAANLDFETQGNNAADAGVTFDADGGILLTTAGADGDEEIIAPHADTKQSAWNGVEFSPDSEPRFECLIRTQASITAAIIWAGLKLTGAEAIATDNDQIYFRIEDDVNAGRINTIQSIANVDTTLTPETTVTSAINTTYHLMIDVDSSRIARTYVNGVLIGTSAALTAAAALKPFIGVAADGAAGAKALQVYWLKCSRLYA